MMELLKTKKKFNIVHVPYQGAAPAMQALLAGQVQATSMTLSVVLPFVKAGKLKCLVVTGDRRWDDLPDVPTITKSGFADSVNEYLPGVVRAGWNAAVDYRPHRQGGDRYLSGAGAQEVAARSRLRRHSGRAKIARRPGCARSANVGRHDSKCGHSIALMMAGMPRLPSFRPWEKLMPQPYRCADLSRFERVGSALSANREPNRLDAAMLAKRQPAPRRGSNLHCGPDSWTGELAGVDVAVGSNAAQLLAAGRPFVRC